MGQTYAKQNGVWKACGLTIYVKRNGVWKHALPWAKHEGVWKKAYPEYNQYPFVPYNSYRTSYFLTGSFSKGGRNYIVYVEKVGSDSRIVKYFTSSCGLRLRGILGVYISGSNSYVYNFRDQNTAWRSHASEAGYEGNRGAEHIGALYFSAMCVDTSDGDCQIYCRYYDVNERRIKGCRGIRSKEGGCWGVKVGNSRVYMRPGQASTSPTFIGRFPCSWSFDFRTIRPLNRIYLKRSDGSIWVIRPDNGYAWSIWNSSNGSNITLLCGSPDSYGNDILIIRRGSQYQVVKVNKELSKVYVYNASFNPETTPYVNYDAGEGITCLTFYDVNRRSGKKGFFVEEISSLEEYGICSLSYKYSISLSSSPNYRFSNDSLSHTNAWCNFSRGTSCTITRVSNPF